MSWWIDVLEGVAATAPEIGSGIYNVLSSTKAELLLADEQVLARLAELAGTEISPIVNNLGETIGYAARSAAASNGTTAISNTWISIAREATVVTEEIQQAALPLLEGGTTADLAIGTPLANFAADATTGVGGAAGTGVGSTALATVAGPAIAVALGVGAGVALYNLAPEFWTNVSERLTSAGKMIGDKVISWFKTDGTEYYDDATIDIIRQALIEEGVLSETGYPKQASDSSITEGGGVQPLTIAGTELVQYYPFAGPYIYKKLKWDCVTVVAQRQADVNVGGNISTLYASATPRPSAPYAEPLPSYAIIMKRGSKPSDLENARWESSGYGGESSFTYNGKTVYYGGTGIESTGYMVSPAVPGGGLKPNMTLNKWDAWIAIYGDLSGPPVPNELPEEDNTGTTVSPIPTSVTDPLRKPSTDPDYKPTDYYDPTPSPTPTPDDNPTPQVDPSPQPDPEPSPDPHPQPDPTNPTNPTDTNPDTPGNEDTGDSPIPPVIIPMAASAVSKIFNPTQGEVDALGQYLWSSTNIEDILKLFQSPLDGIIALFKLYATPVTGSHEGIKLGYLPTGVSAAVVTRQVVTVDCGEIEIPLSKQNATDYPPYTTIQIYLPFIGIEPLNAYDLVGSRLACQYRVDCYTGACIAQLIVKRDNMNAKLYEFSGNCAQQIPLTSGNFLQLAGNIISGAITGAVHGGAVGAAVGAGSSLIHSNVEVGRSGNLSANAGMLGSRIPYIIITRAISADATNYSYFYGYPANKNVYLRNCRGYVRVKDIILHTSATEAEKSEIERLLKEGVYI